MESSVFFIVVVAAIFHASWNFFAKATSANKLSVLWAGQVLAGLVTLPLALYSTDLTTLGPDWFWFVIGTGVIHGAYIILLAWAYSLGDISVVYPVARGVGIIGTATVAIATGIDQVSTLGVAGITFIVGGVTAIGLKEWPQDSARKVLYVATAVGFSIACGLLFDKLAMSQIPPLLYAAALNLSSPLFCLPVILGKLRQPTLEAIRSHRKAIAIVGFGGLGTYALILWAFQFGPASYVVALRESSVVMAAGLGVFVLKEKTSKRKVAGVLLVLFGAVLIKLA